MLISINTVFDNAKCIRGQVELMQIAKTDDSCKMFTDEGKVRNRAVCIFSPIVNKLNYFVK